MLLKEMSNCVLLLLYGGIKSSMHFFNGELEITPL